MAQVSVIIPTFNRRFLLEETLASVLRQTDQDFEIVVVNDGSDDETDRFLDSCASPVRAIRIDHRGVGAARNAGLAEATGNLIAFLDDDDMWHPEFLARMTAALEENRQAGFSYCDYSAFDHNGMLREYFFRREEKTGDDLLPLLIEGDFLCIGGALIRRDAIAGSAPFDLELPPAEDWAFWLGLACRTRAVCVDRPLLQIRYHSGNHSRDSGLMWRCNLNVLEKFLVEHPETPALLRRAARRNIRRNHFLLGRLAVKERRLRPAIEHFARLARSL